MNKILLVASLALVGCSGSSPNTETPVAPTSDPTAAPTSEASSAAPDAAASSAPSATASAAPAPGQEVSIESSNAKGVDLKNESGKAISIGVLGFKKFARKTAGLPSTEVPSANVSFGSVEADGATASDVSCELAPWPAAEADVATTTTIVVTMALQDSVPAASVLKVKQDLLACSAKKPIRLTWSFKDDKVTEVSGGDVDRKCLEKALAKSVAWNTGRCAATIAP